MDNLIENSVLEALKNRRSIRHFSNESISEQQLLSILESARWAPSWLNMQAWRFIVVNDPDIRYRLCKAVPTIESAGVNEAPVCIAICVRDYPGSAHIAEDGAAATLQMAIAAQSMGLGTYWVGVFDQENKRGSSESVLRNILKIPHEYRLVSLLPVGVPAATPTPTRKKLEKLFCYNTFSFKKEDNPSADEEKVLATKLTNDNWEVFSTGKAYDVFP